MWFGNFDIASGTPSMSWLNAIDAYFGGYFLSSQGSSENGDSWEHTFTLEKGTYSIRTRGATAAIFPKINYYIDDVLVITAQDWYSAGTDREVEKIVAAIAVTTSGLHTLTITVNGKNASSSDYSVGLTMIDIY